jgi:glyceraldehyde 3-phosphate dehydrogenase
VILNVTFQTEMLPDGTVSVDREAINAIYEEASKGEARGLVKYSEEQNVSTDMIGEDAAVVIEAVETHTRTGFVDLKLSGGIERIPMTHVKVFGWYDNELGSYTHRLGQLTSHVAASL